jgi:putative membrane protein
MTPSAQEQQQINELVAQFEAASGAQAVVAIVGKADSYPEIPWKAFALGASLAALAVTAGAWLGPGWASVHSPLSATAAMLGTGAALGLLAAFVPACGRLFLDRVRADAEARQYAQALFLERRLDATAARTGVLILLSLYERAIVVLPDAGLAARLDCAVLERLIGDMAPLLARGRTVEALRAGLGALARALRAGGLKPGAGGNELPDAVIVEKGA